MFRSLSRFWSPAFSILMLYLVFGSLWVLATDMIVDDWLQQNPSLEWVHTLKGWLFVVVSGILFYLVISRYFQGLHQARQLLGESSRHYTRIFRDHPQPMWICEGGSGRILEANQAASRVYGFSEQQFLGMTMGELQEQSNPAGGEEQELQPEELFRTRQGVQHRLADGTLHPVEVVWQQLPESTGTRRYLVSAFGAWQQASGNPTDPVVEASRRQPEKLMKYVPGMAYRCLNDEHWTMLFVEGNCRELTGYACEELVNNTLMAFDGLIDPEDRKSTRDKIQEAVGQKLPYDLKYRIVARDGTRKWVRERARGIFDNHDQLMYLEGFITDVSDQVRHEHALEYQGELLRSILDNIPFPLFYKDLDGRYLGCNKSFCQFVGKDYEEIIGDTVFNLFASEVAAFFHQQDQALVEKGEEVKYETQVVFADGRIMDAVFHKCVYNGPDGQPAGIIGVYFDISERIRAENTIKRQMSELERINRELENFTYTVSHDLRSPLVTIKGFLGMLREDALAGNHEQMEMDIERISNATDKMHFLLEDLLQLSRIGRVGNPFTRFPMNGVVDDLLEYIDGIIRESQCQIIVQPDMPEVVGDRNRIMELLQNLVENALKFRSPHRELIIEIGCRTNEPVPVFYVKDNGQGIDPSFHKKVFGLFSKLDPRTSGTGIGLALVHRIVEFHGGSIWVESEGEDKGTCFCFTLLSE